MSGFMMTTVARYFLFKLQEDTLTNHPAKRNVMNFMRVLIVDALSLPASQKTQPVIDLLVSWHSCLVIQ